ncbi:hypothetical protein VTK56DRAFT_527 [Thermocarpiscus australiensis]
MNKRELSPRPSSVLPDDDGDPIVTNSRPSSLALMPPASACSSAASPPSLRDILTNSAQPPYTLGAFMAFLSQNHCLETLEFTMDAERYRTAYLEFITEAAVGAEDGNEHVCSLWAKLMHAYIFPCGPREVNLPADVRDRLLSLPAMAVPPNPSELDEAARIIYELMNDSVLGPFLTSVATRPGEISRGEVQELKHARSRPWMPRNHVTSTADESSQFSRTGLLPVLSIPWTGEPRSSASSSSDPAEREGGLSDDSAKTPSSTGQEPTTPPATPPTLDWGSNTSPGGLQRALSAHSSGWKRMGAKLGLNRMGRSKRSHTSAAASAGADRDHSMSDSDLSRGGPL